MKHAKLFLAFGLGFVSAVALFSLFNNSVQATGSDELTVMENRLNDIEKAAAQGRLPQTVKAPFAVVDPDTNKLMFYVNDNHVDFCNKNGTKVVWIDGLQDGGQIMAESRRNGLVTRFGATDYLAGLTVSEDGTTKIELNRRKDTGTYRLLFHTRENQNIAGIGQSGIGTGLAFVDDAAGNLRAAMQTTGEARKGLFAVFGANGKSIAELTEGDSGGGRMALFNNEGDNMVVAGVESGNFGVVRAGPGSFMPGYGTLGLPGSFILGKKKK